MSRSKLIKIAMVDNHPLIIKGFFEILSRQSNFEIGFAVNDGIHVLHAIESAKPDIILMDVRMPLMDGIEATKLVKQHYPKIMVIAVSIEEDEKTVINMLRSGASAYLCKDSEPEEIILAINEVYNKGFYFNKIITAKLLEGLGISNTKKPSKELINLSEREMEILILMCMDKTTKEIAFELNASMKTISKHRENMHKKTRTHTPNGLVIFAMKNGIINLI